MADKQSSLQDVFLNGVRRLKIPVTMFLVKGVKLQGVVTWFDNFSVLLRRDGQMQLVYKHAISTIMPSQEMDLEEIEKLIARPVKNQPVLQDIFLNALCDSEINVTMFLINGVMLQGSVVEYDLFSVLLIRDRLIQLVYKHAVSTIQPSEALNLSAETDGPEQS